MSKPDKSTRNFVILAILILTATIILSIFVRYVLLNMNRVAEIKYKTPTQEESSYLLVTKGEGFLPEILAPQISVIDPQKGGVTAAITIVEYSDFSCPYCAMVQATLRELERLYPGKIKLIWKDFPIEDLHPGTSQLHEAARCAWRQGKFWEYHDLLFANQGRVDEKFLLTAAEELALNTSKFSSCLEKREMSILVGYGLEEGRVLGISGTPWFFINEQIISGAVELENFIAVIEAELKKSP